MYSSLKPFCVYRMNPKSQIITTNTVDNSRLKSSLTQLFLLCWSFVLSGKQVQRDTRETYCHSSGTSHTWLC